MANTKKTGTAGAGEAAALPAIQPVPFHGMSLSALRVNGAPYVAIRPICDALGLNWSSQRKRILRDPELKTRVVMMTTPSAGGAQKTLLLPLDCLNGWLFGVDVARVRAELRERMNWYRRECFDVLARHFGLSPGDTASALREQLHQAEGDERRSFIRASQASRAMNRRRKEKPALLDRIAGLREAIQLSLPLGGSTA